MPQRPRPSRTPQTASAYTTLCSMVPAVSRQKSRPRAAYKAGSRAFVFEASILHSSTHKALIVGGNARQPQTYSAAQSLWHARTHASLDGAQDRISCNLFYPLSVRILNTVAEPAHAGTPPVQRAPRHFDGSGRDNRACRYLWW